jgi:hypothetical protein
MFLREYLYVSNCCASQKDSDDKVTLPEHTFQHANGISVINTTELADYLLRMASEAFRMQLKEFVEGSSKTKPSVVDIPLDNEPAETYRRIRDCSKQG